MKLNLSIIKLTQKKSCSVIRLAAVLLLFFISTQSALAEDVNNPSFDKISSEINSTIESNNLDKYEQVLLPQLAEFIIALGLKLKITSIKANEQSIVADSEQFARDLLQNNYPKYTEIDQDIITLGSTSKKTIQTSVIRIGAEENRNFEFKEKVSVLTPGEISKIKFLTIRQKDKSEDLFWYFSASLDKSIQLTSSNRSDWLFNSAYSLDDIFMTGFNFNNLITSGVKVSDFLVPAIQESAWNHSSSIESECDSFSSSIKDAESLSEKISLRRMPVYMLDLKNSDPFSTVGRYRLYYNAENMTPVMKEEFSHQAELKKIALFLSYRTTGKNILPLSTIIIENPARQKKSNFPLFISTVNGRVCSNLPGDFNPSDLDPSGYWKN